MLEKKIELPKFDQQLKEELYRSARLRSLLLAPVFLLIALGFSLSVVLDVLPDRFYNQIGGMAQYQWQLLLQCLCGGLELAFFFVLNRALHSNFKIQWLMYGIGFMEISAISFALWTHAQTETLLIALNAPPLLLYGLLIFSLALFLEARHCILAGAVAAVQYGWIIHSTGHIVETLGENNFYPKTVFLFLTGVTASAVAAQIRKQLMNTFQAQLEAQQQLLAQKQHALEEQQQLTEAYRRFVPAQFLTLLEKPSILEVNLGDHVQREMSILFSDIRNFTTISEQMSPQQNFEFINSYLKQIGPLIQIHHGYIDKYIGDAIMALFGQSADDALNAAIAMQRELQQWNQTQTVHSAPIKIGIGINTGSLILGTVGETNRMEGTVISDAVNLASRLESLTKSYNAKILISEFTLQHLQKPETFNIHFIDKVQVKGRVQAVKIFEVHTIEE